MGSLTFYAYKSGILVNKLNASFLASRVVSQWDTGSIFRLSTNSNAQEVYFINTNLRPVQDVAFVNIPRFVYYILSYLFV